MWHLASYCHLPHLKMASLESSSTPESMTSLSCHFHPFQCYRHLPCCHFVCQCHGISRCWLASSERTVLLQAWMPYICLNLLTLAACWWFKYLFSSGTQLCFCFKLRTTICPQFQCKTECIEAKLTKAMQEMEAHIQRRNQTAHQQKEKKKRKPQKVKWSKEEADWKQRPTSLWKLCWKPARKSSCTMHFVSSWPGRRERVY